MVVVVTVVVGTACILMTGAAGGMVVLGKGLGCELRGSSCEGYGIDCIDGGGGNSRSRRHLADIGIVVLPCIVVPLTPIRPHKRRRGSEWRYAQVCITAIGC
eukprot:GFYU01085191.1.p2 GENE.GFYU01085191.1~~GFYU01085191.1.p2  ORF type:complete len:102 (-),score=15.30 GFYU01085191.1:60-365(-)